MGTLFSDTLLHRFRTGHPLGHDLEVFIETGTFLGHLTRRAAGVFDRVVSIEASHRLATDAANDLRDCPTVTVLEGDSATLLPETLARFDCPCAIYLDAHYVNHPDVATTPFPLWAELAACALRPRSTHDLVVVDDVKSFGVAPEWEKVTVAAVRSRLAPFTESEIVEDHLLVWR